MGPGWFRHHQPEDRSTRTRRLQVQDCSCRARQLSAQGQPQAGPSDLSGAAGLEQVGHERGRDSLALVVDPENQSPGFLHEGEDNDPRAGAGLDCIGHQVLEDDQDEVGDVIVDGPERRGLTLDPHPLLRGHPMEATAEMVEDFRGRKLVPWQIRILPKDAGHLLDQGLHTTGRFRGQSPVGLQYCLGIPGGYDVVKSHHWIPKSVEQVGGQRSEGCGPGSESQFSPGHTEIPACFQQLNDEERHGQGQQNAHHDRTRKSRHGGGGNS